MNLSGAEKTIAKFPFVMVISSMFLRGAVFLLINAPVLYHIFKHANINSLELLFEIGIIDTWKSIIQFNNSIFGIFILLLVALFIGIIIIPIEGSFSIIIACIINLYLKRKENFIPFFSQSEMGNPYYTSLLSWLIKNPDAKLHWEWQLLHYYIYWGIATNFLIFFIISFIILGINITFLNIITISIPLVMSLIFAILHSRSMGKVHYYYFQEALKSRQLSKI